MKTIKLTIDANPLDLLKETREERKERIKYAQTMTTRVADKNKKKYNRQRYKNEKTW